MIEDKDCQNCGNALSEENTKKLWFKPYCTDCWPSECPICGEDRNYFYSLSNHRLECDQGCHFEYNVDLAKYGPNGVYDL